jgi:hypothetical protein
MSTLTRRVSRLSMQQITAIAMIFFITVLIVPAPSAAAMLRSTEQTVSEKGSQVLKWLGSGFADSTKGTTQGGNRERKGVRPSPALTKVRIPADRGQ